MLNATSSRTDPLSRFRKQLRVRKRPAAPQPFLPPLRPGEELEQRVHRHQHSTDRDDSEEKSDKIHAAVFILVSSVLFGTGRVCEPFHGSRKAKKTRIKAATPSES